MNITRTKTSLLVGMLLIPLTSSAADEIEEILVTAEFREAAVVDIGSSVSIIDSETIAHVEARHLEQILNLVPNVNYSSGASRGRFIQIRGIGERSQFIEPLNPSVGILIDGIDFTGIGGAATTMDLKQIEILRGPQGTLFGANALAGLINLKSNDPTSLLTGNVEASVGSDGLRSLGGVISGPINDELGYRLAINNHQSDGYVKNDFLNRDDTNDIDELSLRGKLHWQASEELLIKLTGFYVDIDNGYDTFSLDNTRHTLSDEPGHDRQESTALAVESIWHANGNIDVVALVSYADSKLEYSFDEDWSYLGLCTGTPCEGWEYSSFDNYLRDRENITVDVRLISQEGGKLFNDSSDWVLGVYMRDQDVSLLRQYTFAAGDFTSIFDTRNWALYGQLDTHLSDRLTLSTGLRVERRKSDYKDSDDVIHDTRENLWGGRIALLYSASDNTLVYGSVSRGYKAGGVNSNPSLDEAAREFDTEHMWNLETGIKGRWLDDRLQAQIALFYQLRDMIQVKQSLVEPIVGDICPCSFTDYFDNASKGSNFGLELEFNWQPIDALRIYGSIGLLDTEFDDFLSFTHVNADPENGIPVDLNGHDQPHAPSYQFAFGGELTLVQNLSFSLDVDGKDKFYLSPRHEEQTKSYELLHAKLRYRADKWEVSLWGRNLTDKDVIVRGFGSFGNDPRKFYATEPYYQYGQPRVFGVTARYGF
jgi:outer membrane receptor protein involved in Fe transport